MMPARRITTVTVPVQVRSGVAFEAYRDRTPLLTIWATRPAAGQLPSKSLCLLTRLLRLGACWTQAAGSRRVPRSTRDSSRLP